VPLTHNDDFSALNIVLRSATASKALRTLRGPSAQALTPTPIPRAPTTAKKPKTRLDFDQGLQGWLTRLVQE
jgi:hypothetical protein